MLNIAVLVSGSGTNLQAIIDAIDTGKITNCKIACVVANKADVYSLTRAKNHNIESQVVLKKDYADNSAFNKGLIDTLKPYNIDLIVLAGFLSILSSDFIQEYKDRIINIHPSLIPAFCGDGCYGLHVHEKALDYGVKVSGATVHFVNEITDGGEIILQKAIDIKCDDTPQTLQKRIMENCEWQILPMAIDLFCNNKLKIVDRKVLIKE